MKKINYFMLRTILALVLGLVLIFWPGEAFSFLVVTIGILFMIPGLISIIGFLVRDREKNPETLFPLTGAGSVLFGLLLVIAPEFFINLLMYVMGAILLLGGIEQLVILVRARKWTRVAGAFYLFPTLILLAGIVVLFNPFAVAKTTFIVLGITCLVYAVSECVGWIRFGRRPELTEESPTA